MSVPMTKAALETLLELENLIILPREGVKRSMSPSGSRMEAMSAAMLAQYLAKTDAAPCLHKTHLVSRFQMNARLLSLILSCTSTHVNLARFP